MIKASRCYDNSEGFPIFVGPFYFFTQSHNLILKNLFVTHMINIKHK
jgi:hypothetical protein